MPHWQEARLEGNHPGQPYAEQVHLMKGDRQLLVFDPTLQCGYCLQRAVPMFVDALLEPGQMHLDLQIMTMAAFEQRLHLRLRLGRTRRLGRSR
ncbi:hypothetical protein D3C80_723190 [compost metagenome]